MNNILKKGISGLLLLGALFMLPQGADARAAAGHYVRTNAAGQVNGTLDVFEIKGQQYFDVHAYNHEGSDPRPVKTGMADNMITAGPVTDDTFKITNRCYKVKIYTEKTLQLQESFLVPMAMQDVYRVAYDNSVTKIF